MTAGMITIAGDMKNPHFSIFIVKSCAIKHFLTWSG
jgi:hypothetical protein